MLKAVGFAGVSVVPSRSCSMICGEGARGESDTSHKGRPRCCEGGKEGRKGAGDSVSSWNRLELRLGLGGGGSEEGGGGVEEGVESIVVQADMQPPRRSPSPSSPAAGAKSCSRRK